MQTNHFYLAVIGALLAGPLAFSAHAGTVEVRVTGVDNELGKVQVALCDKETFLKQCRYSASAPAHCAPMACCNGTVSPAPLAAPPHTAMV